MSISILTGFIRIISGYIQSLVVTLNFKLTYMWFSLSWQNLKTTLLS